MRRLIAFLLALVSHSAAIAQAWPPLPTTAFISGSPATEEDVTNGNAVFVAKSHDGYVGVPLKIAIPQYAYLNEANGRRKPVIVVQAEEANGIKMVGARDFEGKDLVATLEEFQLPGAKPPD